MNVQFAFCHIQGLMSSFNTVWPIYNKRAAVGMLHILCESCHTQNVGLRVSLSVNMFTNLERFALVGTSSILHDKALVISVSGDGGNLVWKSNDPENKKGFGIKPASEPIGPIDHFYKLQSLVILVQIPQTLEPSNLDREVQGFFSNYCERLEKSGPFSTRTSGEARFVIAAHYATSPCIFHPLLLFRKI